MGRIWAPWRMEFIKSARVPDDACIFCKMLESKSDEENLILTRSEHAFVVMNKYPYTNGHLLIVPRLHTASLASLTAEVHADLGKLLSRSCDHLKAVCNPHGFNIGMNLGLVAGAGIADHLHYHIVPRWSGDTSFMAVFADTRVINQSLSEMYSDLAPLFRE